MRVLLKSLGIVFTLMLALVSCEEVAADLGVSDADRLIKILTPPGPNGSVAGLRSGPAAAIWADCSQFGTIGTNTSFKPSAGKFDQLYNGANFMGGLGAISESKPGDQDYNGGRWHVNTLKEGIDPDKYLNVCAVEDLDLDDFESTDVYFECPLLPIH